MFRLVFNPSFRIIEKNIFLNHLILAFFVSLVFCKISFDPIIARLTTNNDT